MTRVHKSVPGSGITLLQITKAAIVLTVIFIVTFSYNLWFFLLGTIGLFKFQTDSFHQAFSQWVTSFNCFVNPFVYLIIMPVFAKSLKKTFCCCCFREQKSGVLGGRGRLNGKDSGGSISDSKATIVTTET